MVVREGAEPRPDCLGGKRREGGPGEAEVAGDDRRQALRRLEGEPSVVADLGERARTLGEVDAASTGVDVARPNPHVLDVHPPDERAERAQLRRRVEAAADGVREVEVAPERRRRHARGQLPDASGVEEALEAQAHATLGGVRAELGERSGAPLDVLVAPQLGLEEERDEHDACAERLGEADRRAHLFRRTSCRSAILGCDAAVVVVAEHERVDLETCGLRRLCPSTQEARFRLVQVGALDGQLDSCETEPRRRDDGLIHAEDAVHDGGSHDARSTYLLWISDKCT